MWRAATGIIVGLLLGAFLTQDVDAKKNKKPPKENPSITATIRIEDDNVAKWTHICCDCALTHYVEMDVIRYFSLDGSARHGIRMTWVVDSDKTNKNRVRKFGPFWDRQTSPFSAENPESDRW